MVFDAGSQLIGTGRWSTFLTQCRTSIGWRERCEATIFVDSAHGTAAIALRRSRGSQEVMPTTVPVKALIYLRSANGGGEWSPSWTGRAAPLAIGLVANDTVILPLGWAR
jgi:hypothetical protein